jgi:hypothetical protein
MLVLSLRELGLKRNWTSYSDDTRNAPEINAASFDFCFLRGVLWEDLACVGVQR